jgi:hypothetical protein
VRKNLNKSIISTLVSIYICSSLNETDKLIIQITLQIDNNIRTTDKTIEYRRNCAFNIPAMFLFASTVPEGINTLIPTFRNLANDSNYMVRRTIACSLHEVLLFY